MVTMSNELCADKVALNIVGANPCEWNEHMMLNVLIHLRRAENLQDELNIHAKVKSLTMDSNTNRAVCVSKSLIEKRFFFFFF